MADEPPEAVAEREPAGVNPAGAAQTETHQAVFIVQRGVGLIGSALRAFDAGLRIGLGGHFAAVLAR